MALARNQRTVLEVLAASERELAGIEVAARLGGLARSSVYAALAALQRDGLVRARWDLPRAAARFRGGTGSHPRRLVRISAAGRRALAQAEAGAAPRAALRRRPAAEGGAS